MDALLLAVLNALWQGAALIALVTLALRAGLRRNATTACVVWTLAFAIVALLPALDIATARAPSATALVPASAPVVAPLRSAAPPRALAPDASARAVGLPATAIAAAVPAAPAPVAATRASIAAGVGHVATWLGRTVSAFARAWGPLVVSLWGCVALVLLLRIAAAYGAVARVKRGAVRIDDAAIAQRLRDAGHRRVASVASSHEVDVPCAIGFHRPMIVIPAPLVASLDPEDLARIVLHESAHLQRYDDWTNALEQVVCAVQFFQPALYVARRRIDFEREVACDDRVLADAGEPLRYAECLARIVQREGPGRRAALVPGFVLRRPQVIARVRRIVDRSRDASTRLRAGAMVVVAAVMVATTGIARLQVPLVAPAPATPHPSSARPARVAPVRAASPVVGHARRSRVAPPAPLARVVPLAHVVAPAHVVGLPQVVPLAHVGPLHSVAPLPHLAPQRAVRTVPREAARAVAAAPAPKAIRAEPATTTLGVVVAADDPHPSPSPSPSASPIVIVMPPGTVRLEDVLPKLHLAESLPKHEVLVRVNNEALSATMPALRKALADVVVSSPSSVVLQTQHGDGGLLDAIDQAKYPRPSVDELVALRAHGVTGDYVRGMGALGRNRPSLHDMIGLAAQGIRPEYVATLNARLATPPSIDEAIALHAQGLTARYLDNLAAAGYPKLSAADAVALATHGVGSAYVRAMLDAGMRSLTPAQLIALHQQGIDGTFVRHLADHGYRNLSVDDLVRLRASGLTP